MAQDFLDHLEGTKNLPEVQRFLDILPVVEASKGSYNQGIQDRNALPDANQDGAIEVASLAAPSGR
jgi:hypothetical protein